MAAGDFYFAINATFRFFLENYGEEALHRYWTALGRGYYAPLAQRFRDGGLAEVERYWREFFAEEPGAEVEIAPQSDRMEIVVNRCPAIHWLREHGRSEVEGYCRHCEFVSKAIAADAGMTFELNGGGGSCRQTFRQETSL